MMLLNDSVLGPQHDSGRGSPHSGLGPCTKCECQKFMGYGNICQYCYHHYDHHSIGTPFGVT
jgi:hypothetical protein